MASLWNIFKRTKKPRYAILIDVGTYSVRSLLVETAPAGLIGLKKQTHIFTKRERTEHLAEAIGMRLRELVFRSIKNLGAVPASVVVGLASWITYNTVTTEIFSRPDKEQPISHDELRRAGDRFREAHREVEWEDESFMLADAEMVRVAVDGYDIPRAQWEEGAAGAELGVSFALTYIRKDLFRELEKLRTVAGGIPLHITPAHAAIASLIIGTGSARDFLLLKIGGAITEVSAVEKETLLWTETIPFGGLHVTEKIASALGVSISRAEELKRQYGALRLSERLQGGVRRIVAEEVEAFRGRVREILKARRWLVPEAVYLYGGGAHMPEIAAAFSESAWYGDLTYREALTVRPLDAEFFAKPFFVNAVLRGPEDMDLAGLAAVYLRRPLEQSTGTI